MGRRNEIGREGRDNRKKYGKKRKLLRERMERKRLDGKERKWREGEKYG